jgi:DNA-binding transcriptional MocR family regulator
VALHIRVAGRTAADIAAAIEDELHAGRVAPGGGLPPVRDLATRLKVSPATVAAAYKLLRVRGLIAGAGRAGTRVTPHPPSPVSKRHAPLAEGLVDLASGNPDPDLLPPLESALRSIAPRPHLYGEPGELRPLMTFLSAEFEADGIPAQSMALVSGALDGLERVLREHLRPGDAVAVEDPSFPGVLDLLAASGYARLPFAVDDEGPLPDSADAAVRRAKAIVMTPRAQNPTGAALTLDRARDLQRILRRHTDVLLIENDPAGPVAGTPAATLAGAAVARWAVIRSTSKFLGPDLRLAAIAGDALTIARVEGRQALGARWISTILQRLVLALWSDPSSGRLLARAAEVYAQRRTALVTALAARGLAAYGRSGFNVWVPVRHEAPVVQALADAGWAVMAGERFRLRSPPAIRITTSSLRPADADRLAADLAAIAPMGSSRAAAC